MSLEDLLTPYNIPDFGPEHFLSATATDNQVINDLSVYKSMLESWNTRLNLVGPSALQDFWLRHAYDSAQLLSFAPRKKVWADIGAGAGFPGLVLSIMLKRQLGTEVHLIDSMAKRTRFLGEVVRELQLPAIVYTARAETVQLPRQMEVVTARACAPLSKLLQLAAPILSEGVVGLFLKGRGIDDELDEARRSWSFKSQTYPSQSGASGRVVQIEALRCG